MVVPSPGIGAPCFVTLLTGTESVAARIDAGPKGVAVVEAVRHLGVEVVEVVAKVLFDGIYVEFHEATHGDEHEVEPAGAEAEVERSTTSLHSPPMKGDGPFDLQTSLGEADDERAMIVLHIALAGAGVNNRGYAPTVASRETTLVEVDVLHDIGVERREEAEGVVGVVEGRTVDEEEILVAIATVDVEVGGQFGTGRHTREALDGLHEVRGAEEGKLRVEVVERERRLARLRGVERRVEVGRHLHFLQFDGVAEAEVLLRIGRKLQRALLRLEAHIRGTQLMSAGGQEEQVAAVLIADGTPARGHIVDRGAHERFAPLVRHDALDHPRGGLVLFLNRSDSPQDDVVSALGVGDVLAGKEGTEGFVDGLTAEVFATIGHVEAQVSIVDEVYATLALHPHHLFVHGALCRHMERADKEED